MKQQQQQQWSHNTAQQYCPSAKSMSLLTSRAASAHLSGWRTRAKVVQRKPHTYKSALLPLWTTQKQKQLTILIEENNVICIVLILIMVKPLIFTGKWVSSCRSQGNCCHLVTAGTSCKYVLLLLVIVKYQTIFSWNWFVIPFYTVLGFYCHSTISLIITPHTLTPY